MSNITFSSITRIYLACLLVGTKAESSISAKAGFIFSPNLMGPLSKNSHRDGCHQLQVQTSSQQQQEHASGRRWKNKRKRQTFLPSPTRNVSPEEEDALMDQLGYVPPNVCRVSARSGDYGTAKQDVTGKIDTSSVGIGRPIATQSYPLLVQLMNTNTNNIDDKSDDSQNKNYTPFPTLYWLTCPHVSRAISDLERQGHVRDFQLKLEADSELATKWWESHEEYASERWSILSDQDQEWLLEQNDGEERKRQSMKEMIQYSGVAGTDHRGLRKQGEEKDEDFVPSVKCLHSHYAHYRSQIARLNSGVDGAEEVRLNVIGEWTHSMLLEQFPDTIF